MAIISVIVLITIEEGMALIWVRRAVNPRQEAKEGQTIILILVGQHNQRKDIIN